MALFFIISLVEAPLGGNPSFEDAIFLVIGALSLIPLYGYAHSLAIGSKKIAIILFTINFLVSLYSIFQLLLSEPLSYDPIILATDTFLFLFICLYMYPQYAYAFKSNNIWKSNA